LDFSATSLSDPDAAPWFPRIEALTGKTVDKKAKTFSIFSAGGTAIASLALALRRAGLESLVAVLLNPVSEAGREGIEELETQTSQLLSFQSVGQQVFGAQAAFNLLPRYGHESREDLHRSLLRMRAEVSAVAGDVGLDQGVAINLVHAPVFYGITFSACATFEGKTDSSRLKELCHDAGFVFVTSEEPGPSNVSVAGETSILLGDPEPDAAHERTWWFWGAADNLGLPASSGCKLAELLES
jgi:aspartate-semialdehyde dehydrogenase